MAVEITNVDVLSQVPTDLDIRRRVLPLLGKEWRTFCCYLGIKYADMRKAEEEHPRNIDETIFTCVKKWLNGTANKPVTWEFLLEALEGSELKEPATDLRCALTSLEVPSRGEFELDRQDSTPISHHIAKNPLKSWRYLGTNYSHYLPKLILLLVIFTVVNYYIHDERFWMDDDALNCRLQAENERLVLENEDLRNKVFTLLHYHSPKQGMYITEDQFYNLQKTIMTQFRSFMNTTLVQCSEGIGETCQKLAERQRQSFSSEIEQIHNSFNNFHSDWQLFQSDKIDASQLHSLKMADLPIPTTYAASVTIGHHVYVAGGVSGDVGWAQVVQVLDTVTGRWTTLPPAPQYCSEPVSLNNTLILLGGVESETGRTTNMVSTWLASQEMWAQTIPPMKQERWRPGVLLVKNFLLVCGGTSKTRDTILDSCEVLNVAKKQWRIVPLLLPQPLYGFRLGVYNETVFLTGAWHAVSRPTTKSWKMPLDSLEKIISNSIPPAKWTPIADTPYHGPSLLTNSRQPVIVGGFKGHELTNAIYRYTSDEWEHVGNLISTPRLLRPVVVVISSNSFLVLGGHTNPYHYKQSLLNNTELIIYY